MRNAVLQPEARTSTSRVVELRRSVLGLLAVATVAGSAFLLHFNLSTAGTLQLLLVVLVSLGWGFMQATLVSVASLVLLNLLFTQPLFRLSVADAQNWVSLLTFEVTALLVSRLSSRARSNAALSEQQRKRTAKLYELSRAILLIDSRRGVDAQLPALIGELIRELMGVEQAAFWIEHEAVDRPAPEQQLPRENEAYKAYLAGIDMDNVRGRMSHRVLRLGTKKLGAMVLHGWEVDPLLADAVASLAAVALERAHSAEKEMRAEAGRNAEQLRTAVLDGLAHSFKTPLTAIQTASGGLLTIGQLTETQAELAGIIDEQAALLNRLTTRLLQTAALESQEVRLRRRTCRMPELVRAVLREQEPALVARVRMEAAPGLHAVAVDAEMVKLALLQLIDNAGKYSSVGTEIAVRITQEAEETVVTVESEGLPIRWEDRKQIFERFRRGGNAVYGPTGTGLGLSIVKKTAEAHGGRAWVEPKGTRTQFFFTVMGRPRSAE